MSSKLTVFCRKAGIPSSGNMSKDAPAPEKVRADRRGIQTERTIVRLNIGRERWSTSGSGLGVERSTTSVLSRDRAIS